MNERPATPAEAAAPHRITLSWGSNTDRGLRRELNEDSFLAADPIFAVADGMGGHEAGEVASRECIRALREAAALAPGSRTASALDVQQALLQADAKIRELTDSRAGTTATGVVLVEEAGNPYWLVFNVGDSRTYRLSQGKFEQISVDHSEVQELVDAGHITSDQALVHPRRHVVTRALGTGDDTEADYWLIPVEDGDRYLVCSDGLTGELSDQQISQVVSSVAQPQAAVDALLEAALRSGGRDNVTVLIVDAEDMVQAADRLTTAPRPLAEEDTLPGGLPMVTEVQRAPAAESPAAESPAAGAVPDSAVEPEADALDVIEDLLAESRGTEGDHDGA
ncbi:PP2C family protein-serine/threonine phosphatase [Arthrobacter russicus]|uniref:Protein phosphatase n=1 Tax=Arthrobacter russicus TaxID=172040 RepID=A0ABU1JA09_9MICC|nr:protein phosphatase 2C domain-containing protein [Arthrobacter russicus]MDR6268979.1 protein phosphatase [Arthrobacter russicus]